MLKKREVGRQTDWLKLRKRWGRTEKSRKERKTVKWRIWVFCVLSRQQHVNNLWVYSHLATAEAGHFVMSRLPTQIQNYHLLHQSGWASVTNWKTGDFLIGKRKHKIVNAQHSLLWVRNAWRNVSLWILYMSHSAVCVVHVQLIYMLRYNRHRQQRCLCASVPLCTNAWTLTHTKQCSYFFLLACRCRCYCFLISSIQRQKSDYCL